MIRALEDKGFTYKTSDGIYFDTSKIKDYNKLSHLPLEKLKEGARIEINPEKKNPTDFALWKFSPALSAGEAKRQMEWASLWGVGFPGWHIECSAMIRSLLGQEIDIHSGGEDHISTHHNNEIAQSEAANGRTLAHYWMHSAFLTMGGEKISKSLGNGYVLGDVVAKGFHPLALRYFYLQAHYRTPLSFSWDALAGAASALTRLWKISCDIASESEQKSEPSEALTRFFVAIRDDLATPQALGILWDSLRSEEYTPEEKWGLIECADAHLGLSLSQPPTTGTLIEADVPEEIRELLALRSTARTAGDFKEADRIRGDIENSGYHVDDGSSGAVLTKRTF